MPPKGIDMTLFERVKKISKTKGFSSLQTLSEEAGLSPNVVYGWKSKKPSASSLQKVADVLGVSVDYLLGNTDDMYANTDKPKLDIKEVAEKDSWDEYLSSDGRPLSEHDKKVLRALFGE